MLTLAIDTSTSILSIAILQNDTVLNYIEESTKNNQSEILMSRIESLLKKSQIKTKDLTRIVVTNGPGSYTGIRVGVAAAKSLSYAIGIPVYAVSSLEVLAKSIEPNEIIIPMIDARRKTVFAAAYSEILDEILPSGHYEIQDILGRDYAKKLSFVGDGAITNKETILEIYPNALIYSESDFTLAKAITVARLANDSNKVENIHELTPNYLRKTEAELNAGV